MFDQEVLDLALQLINETRGANLQLVTGESCTGGLIAGALTAVPGASDVFTTGIVTYSNNAKMKFLNVSRATLDQHGAVSQATAREMALGALSAADAGLALAVTGIAGPGGGGVEKPVGLVFISAARCVGGKGVVVERHLFNGYDRDGVRRKSVIAALSLGLALF